jgi:hypothetical protein
MHLSTDECWSRIRAAEHGILCTTGAREAIDAVPVCFAVVSKVIVTPIDRVKPKTTTDLSRLRNLGRDAAATLLSEHWNRQDWSELWWVRARLTRRSGHDASDSLLEECEGALRNKYAQYRDSDFAELVLFDVKSLLGWAAAGGTQAGETDPLM